MWNLSFSWTNPPGILARLSVALSDSVSRTHHAICIVLNKKEVKRRGWRGIVTGNHQAHRSTEPRGIIDRWMLGRLTGEEDKVAARLKILEMKGRRYGDARKDKCAMRSDAGRIKMSRS